MFLFKTIYFVADLLQRLASKLIPNSNFADWLKWSSRDAAVLYEASVELHMASLCSKYKWQVGAIDLLESSVFWTACAYGEQTFYGMQSRWPSFLLRLIENAGTRIDSERWAAGFRSGYDDAYYRHCDYIDEEQDAYLRDESRNF